MIADADTAAPRHAPRRNAIVALFRDARVLNVLGQIAFAIILVAAAASIWTSILTSLQSKNLTPNIGFLSNRAGFDIAEHPAWYSSSSTYGDAFRVGVENSLRIIVIGLILTSIIGILGGIFLLSSNWLVRTVTRVVVELLRNTPLLVQLIGWYFVVMLSLPLFQESLAIPAESVYALTWRFAAYAVALAGVFIMVRMSPRGAPRRAYLWSGLITIILTVEILFRLFPTQFGAGRLDNVGAWLFAIIGIALIAAVWRFASLPGRWRSLGAALGLLVGGILFYFGLLPNATFARVEVYPALLLNKRGLVFPEFVPTARFGAWSVFVVVGIIIAGVLWFYLGRITETTGRPTRRAMWATVAIVGAALFGWIVISAPPPPDTVAIQQKDGTTVQMTQMDAIAAGLWTRNEDQLYSRWPLLYVPPVQKISPAGIISGLASGTQITPEYMALLLGLVIYTAAFVAEIVRAGILAVPNGQLEAARALGLTTSETLTLIILPQALRVIIPPLGNQFLNLSKNSSLAIAVAYADLVFVTQTIMNQSGQSVTGITMIMLTYLAISLLLAALTNVLNRRFQIVTR